MEEKIVKLGIVGLWRGLYVGTSVAHDDNVRVTAICDKNPDKIKAALKHFEKIKADTPACFEDFDEMLKTDIDAVYIATDAVCHVPFVVKAMEAGKHVISEIPAVNTLEEAKLLKATVKAHPELKYMTAENCCYWAFIEAWKQMYEAGKLGDAVYAEAEYLHAADYRDYKEENYKNHWRGVNPAIKYITHELGPLLYILDDRCVSVSCMSSDFAYNPYKKGTQTDVAILKTAKGTVIRILICFGAYVDFDHNFTIYGTKGSVETDKSKTVGEANFFARLSDMPRAPGAAAAKIEVPITTAFPGESKEGHGGADVKMLRDFIKCIVEDTKPPIDVDLGIRMTLPGIMAYESFLNGGNVVEIPEIE